MALPVRKSYKGAPVTTTLSALLGAGSTSCTVASVTGWPTTFPFYIVIEPGTSREEKVRVTGATGTTLTIVRAQDDTTAVEHPSASTAYVVFTAVEADEANQIASAMTTKGDLITTDGSSISRLAVGGTNTHVLQVDSAQTNGIKWGQVATAGIADDAVTLPKLAFDLTGVITAFGGSSAPTGWLLCDGTAVSRSTYADLFAVVSTTYGSGDGSSTFNLPNLKGKVPVGQDASQTEFDTLGETGGAKTVTLSSSEIPSHVHNVSAYSHTASVGSTDVSHTHTFSGTVAGDGAHSHTITITDPGHGHDFDYSAVNRTSGGASTSIVGPSGSAAKFPVNTNTTGITASSASATHSHTYSGTTSAASISMNHNHTISIDNHAAKNTDATGGGGAHNNLQPYIVVNYIIKH